MSLGLPHYLTCRQGSLPFRWSYDAPLIERGYLKNLRKELQNSSLSEQEKSLLNLIRIRASQIFHEESEYMIDHTAQYYILITSYLLASHTVFSRAGMADAEINNIITNSIHHTGTIWLKWFEHIGLWWRKNILPFIIHKRTADIAPNRNGEFQPITQYQLAQRKEHCGIYNFFRRHQQPQLSRYICNCSDGIDMISQTDKLPQPTEHSSNTALVDQVCVFQMRSV